MESDSDVESCCSDCSSIVSPEWEPVEQDEDDALTDSEALGTYFKLSYGTCK